jgi:hypothetical protein
MTTDLLRLSLVIVFSVLLIDCQINQDDSLLSSDIEWPTQPMIAEFDVPSDEIISLNQFEHGSTNPASVLEKMNDQIGSLYESIGHGNDSKYCSSGF